MPIVTVPEAPLSFSIRRSSTTGWAPEVNWPWMWTLLALSTASSAVATIEPAPFLATPLVPVEPHPASAAAAIATAPARAKFPGRRFLGTCARFSSRSVSPRD